MHLESNVIRVIKVHFRVGLLQQALHCASVSQHFVRNSLQIMHMCSSLGKYNFKKQNKKNVVIPHTITEIHLACCRLSEKQVSQAKVGAREGTTGAKTKHLF